MSRLLIALAALSMLATTFVAPAQASCWYHCNPDGNGGTTCHWNCY